MKFYMDKKSKKTLMHLKVMALVLFSMDLVVLKVIIGASSGVSRPRTYFSLDSSISND